MMRRRIAAAGIVMAGLLWIGCQQRDPASESGITITFWHSFVSSSVPALNALIAQFEREHPGIHIKSQYIPTGDGLIQKLAAAIQSRTAPDVAWIHADFLDKLVEADAIYPLKQFLNGPNGLSTAELADIVPASLEAGKHRGEIYALPMEATSLALIYNRDLFRRSGLDPDHPPADWNELRSFARRLTTDTNGDGKIDQYGFFVPVFPASGELNIWMILQWMPFLWQAGGSELSPDGSHVAFDSDAGVQALTLWKQIYRELDFARFGIAHDIGFASGKLAMVMDGPWNLPRYRAMTGVDWAVAPLPAGPRTRATYIAGELLAVFKQTEHADAAWIFVKWILEPRVQAQFSMDSGYLPVRSSVRMRPEYVAHLKNDPALRAFIEQMDVGRARVAMGTHRVEINRALAQAIERATLGNEDPRWCLDQAARAANALLTAAGNRQDPK